MTIFTHFNDLLCCIGLDSIIVYNIRDDSIKTLAFPSSVSNLECSKEDSDSCNQNTEKEQLFCLVKISRDGHYLAAVSKSKVLIVWNVHTWELLFTQNLNKRPMSIDFVPSKDEVVVADKAGDVYSFNFILKKNIGHKISTNSDSVASTNGTDESSDLQPILGHFSMLLDMCMSPDGKFIITCDRDEKIRVSLYPNSYSINSFCLGHQEFVSCIDVIPHNESLLVSASGDGTIRLWDYREGLCHSSLDVATFFDNEDSVDDNTNSTVKAITNMTVRKLSSNSSILAASIFKSNCLLLFEIKEKTINYLLKYDIGQSLLPVDMSWITTGELLIYTNNIEEPLLVYDYSPQSSTLSLNKDHSYVKFGLHNKQKLRLDSEITDSILDIQSLYKQRYDNMAEYLQKKQERLDSKASDSEPVVKKKRIEQ